MKQEDRDIGVTPSIDRPNILLGRYRLIAHLGTGGMADVYLAVAKGAMDVNRLVVVKRLHDEQARDENACEMFLNEARLAARLNHPNVVQTTEAGSEQGHYYLVMEYVEGQPLSRFLSQLRKRKTLLEPRLAARVIADALQGLQYAHELRDFDETPLRIVHRDVSPQNIMISYDGIVKLLDFGIAKVVGTSETAHGVFKGKVAYMSPEQVLCQDVDRRADIFAAGILLWEAVTGRRLMADDNPAKTLHNVMNKEIPLASTVTPVPATLDAVIARALSRDVAERYASAKEMREALETFIAQEGGVRNEELGEMLQSMFVETREKTRAQLRAQLAELSFARSGVNSMTRLRVGPAVIDLSEGDESTGSTNRSRRRTAAGVNISIRGLVEPVRSNRQRNLLAAAALLALIGISVAFFRAKDTTAPSSAALPLRPQFVTPTEAPEAQQAKPTQNPLTVPNEETSPAGSASASKARRERAPAPPRAPATAAAAVPRAATPIVEPAPASPPAAVPPTAPKPSHTAAPDAPQGRTFRHEL